VCLCVRARVSTICVLQNTHTHTITTHTIRTHELATFRSLAILLAQSFARGSIDARVRDNAAARVFLRCIVAH
jgi:hypothetical protein